MCTVSSFQSVSTTTALHLTTYVRRTETKSVWHTVTWSGTHVWPQWAGRPGTAILQQECGTGLAADRTGGRPCCIHHREWVSHHHLLEINVTILSHWAIFKSWFCLNSIPYALILVFSLVYLGFIPWKGYRSTCRPAEMPALYVDLPDTTSLSCSEPPAAALFGRRLRCHQLQHRYALPEH